MLRIENTHTEIIKSYFTTYILVNLEFVNNIFNKGNITYINILLVILSLLSKNDSGFIKSPACLCDCVCVCLSMCPPLITFEPIGEFS
jgi:hypothetical protein